MTETVELPKVTAEEQEAFDQRLVAARKEQVETPKPRKINGQLVVWSPQEGAQQKFMTCPAPEVLLHGDRGGGKTDAFLMDYLQFVGRGFGAAWHGVLFRRTYPELADVVAKSEKWFPRIFPEARLNRSDYTWHFPDGEQLLLRHMMRPSDYNKYHGHEYPWIGWEELTNWPTDECYKLMMSTNRSSTHGVPLRVRATTNPHGIGHNWIKTRWKLAGRSNDIVILDKEVDQDGEPEEVRVAIPSRLAENRVLLDVQPGYKKKIAAAATSEAQRKAWTEGSWDITSGGMFDDVWSDRNVVPTFEIPSRWQLKRMFDWGSSKPFAVLWGAISDGSDLALSDGRIMSTIPGDIFLVREHYGWTGHPNQGTKALAVDIARDIVEHELMWGWRKRTAQGESCRVRGGVADSSIFKVENGMSVASDMAKPVRSQGVVYKGIKWRPADKKPGSRIAGWEMMRKMIERAQPKEGLPREYAGLFVVGAECPQFLRTVLPLPRDEKKTDDVDTEAEDHIADAVRYFCMSQQARTGSGTTVGMR